MFAFNNSGDGIFDKLTSKESLRAVWEATYENNYNDVHGFCGKAIENLMRESLVKRTLDNITVVMVAFKNLKNGIFKVRQSQNQGLGLPNIASKKNFYASGSVDTDFPLVEYPLNANLENPNEASDEDSNENLGFSGRFQPPSKTVAKGN